MRQFKGLLLVSAAVAACSAGSARAACEDVFSVKGSTITLSADCTTDHSLIVPDGFTLNGAGHTVTAVDPAGGHFKGGVVQNGGAAANVVNTRITADGLSNVCDGGVDRLRGILFDGASGRIVNNEVTGINQGSSGCQEGNAIEVRNLGASPGVVTAVIDHNTVTGYQKTGIIANGSVSASISDNVVDGGGPVGYIARNGIQVGFGATGQVKGNDVSGNSYTGSSDVSGGVLVVGGPAYGGDFCVGVQIVNNALTGNDVGVYVSQYEADFSAPALETGIKVVNNTIVNDELNNGYVYQAGVSDVGNGDKIIANRISGAGYDPATLPGSTFAVDADASFTTAAKVHANK
jgi:hypothetical protein